MKDLLALPVAYIALQRVVGADRLRYRCIESIQLRPGERLVDIGCGPAYYLDRLPWPVDYHGFDTESRYIDWARRRWGRGTFHLGTFDTITAETISPVDAVMLLGVLHHLSDDVATNLLALVSRVLGPRGRAISLDTCFEDSQGRLSKWMADHDRGQFVRSPGAFEALARPHFNIAHTEVVHGTRIPGSYWTMVLTSKLHTSNDLLSTT